MAVIIYDETGKIPMVQAEVPEGWMPEGHLDPEDYYNGYLAAQNFWVHLKKDPDGIIGFYAPKNYMDDGSGGDLSLRDKSERYILYERKNLTEVLDGYARTGLTYDELELLDKRTYVLADKKHTKKLADEYYAYARKVCKAMSTGARSFVFKGDTVINAVNTYKARCNDGIEFCCAIGATQKNATVLIKENGKEKEAVIWSIEDFCMLTCAPENLDSYYQDFLTFATTVKMTDEFVRYQQEVFERKFPDALKLKSFESRILNDASGIPSINCTVPTDWSAEFKRTKTNNGYGIPFGFSIWAVSPDGMNAMGYRAPLNVIDDSNEQRKSYDNRDIDLYGNLRRSYQAPHEFIASEAANDLGKYSPVLLERRKSPVYANTDFNKLSVELKEEEEKNHTSQYSIRQCDFCMRDAGVWVYSYKKGNTERIRAYHASFRIVSYKDYLKILQDPMYSLIGGMIGGLGGLLGGMMAPPGMSRASDGSILSNSADRIKWYVYDREYLDCVREDFDVMYEDEFPRFIRGVKWTKELNAELDKEQDKIDADLKGARAIYSQMEADSRKASQETWEYVKKTQDEIAEMQRDSWKKSSDSRHKTAMMASETISGWYTYVDSMGREHKVDGYGKHTYMHGDTIVNTDSPYPPGPGWEELTKKYK